MQQPTMFCHDGTTIYYPTGPGRVHMIGIALADCDGSDEDLADSTKVGDLSDLLFAIREEPDSRILHQFSDAPLVWPIVYVERDGVLSDEPDLLATTDDFRDCLEQWADWCDRDAARLDSLDGPAPDEDAAAILARLRSLVARMPYTPQTLAEVVEAIGASAPAVVA